MKVTCTISNSHKSSNLIPLVPPVVEHGRRSSSAAAFQHLIRATSSPSPHISGRILPSRSDDFSANKSNVKQTFAVPPTCQSPIGLGGSLSSTHPRREFSLPPKKAHNQSSMLLNQPHREYSLPPAGKSRSEQALPQSKKSTAFLASSSSLSFASPASSSELKHSQRSVHPSACKSFISNIMMISNR